MGGDKSKLKKKKKNLKKKINAIIRGDNGQGVDVIEFGVGRIATLSCYVTVEWLLCLIHLA